MKISRLLLLLIISLFSCKSEIRTNQFVNISSLVNRGYMEGKASLVYLHSSKEPMCELFDYKIMENKDVKRYINRHFIYYKVDVNNNLFFNRILFGMKVPAIVIIENEEVKSVIAEVEHPNNLLYSLKNYRKEPLELSLCIYSELKGRRETVSKSVNDIFQVIYHIEKKDWTENEIIKHLRVSTECNPCFYNQYLLAEMIKSEQPNEAKEIQFDLIEKFVDPLSLMLFSPEIRRMQNEYYNLDENATPEIEFEYLKFDFGELKQDQVITHKFPFKNISSAPLLIYSVNASCGCAVSKWKQQPILAGETDSISVQYTASSVGKNTKNVSVITNARKRNILLTITATVK